MDPHLEKLFLRRPELSRCEHSIESAAAILLAAFRAGNKLLLCGNGGSAADADHWAGELLKGFCKKRPVSESAGLPQELARQLQCGLPAIPLTSMAAASTAFANDVNPDMVFAQLTWALGKPGDVMVGISTSGKARNVLFAVQAAQAAGIKTIALTGADGGLLASACDLAIRVPATETYLVQELHLPVYHALCMMVEDSLFSA